MVSITQYGLVFNQAAVAALSKPELVMLGFDPEREIIVVKPADEGGDPTLAVPFAPKERNGSVRLATREFLRFLFSRKPELSSGLGTRYSAYWDENERALMVDLRQRHQAISRRRRRAGQER
jgi:hypothetical protein